MNQLNLQSEAITPVVKHLLIINVLVWVATYILNKDLGIDLYKYLALHFYTAQDFGLHQFITYMFMHGDFSHILFNMFSLWMFGVTIERVLGSQRFLIFYIVSGIGAGIIQEVFWAIDPDITSMLKELDRLASLGQPVQISDDGRILSYEEFLNFKTQQINRLQTVGASGAIFALLLAFAKIYPNQNIYFYFIIPIKAKYFVALYAVAELFMGVYGMQTSVAHFAHLGGMLFGYLLLMKWDIKRIY